jgi:hypothetical protein
MNGFFFIPGVFQQNSIASLTVENTRPSSERQFSVISYHFPVQRSNRLHLRIVAMSYI